MDPTPDADPRSTLSRRLEHHRTEAARQGRRVASLADARLAAFAAGALAGGLAYAGWASAWWIAPPLIAFVGLIVAQGRAKARRREADRGASFAEEGLARIEDRWHGTGRPGDAHLDPDHPCAADLDLFGVGSVFEWLCAARTGPGEATLADWLLHAAPVAEIRARQAAVAELGPRLEARERLAMLGDGLRDLDVAALIDWGRTPRVMPTGPARTLAALLAISNLAALLGWVAFGLGFVPLIATAGLSAALAGWLGRRVGRVLEGVDERADDLSRLVDLFAWVESTPFEAPRLAIIRDALRAGDEPASRRAARLARLAGRLEMVQNALLGPPAALALWRTRLAFDLDAWRASSGPRLAGWLAVVGDLEALASLAARAFESPADPFPELVAGPARFEAEGLGHPLLPASTCVRNDVALGVAGGPSALVVSGSNMSGKSTLLRAVGVAAVLARMGGTVRARRLVIAPPAIGATLRVQDSLRSGRSRFYAEILRVKSIVDLARGEAPLLFLLDEVFHGTNSRDRAAGAEGVVRGLVGLGAVGLVSTHDLALAAVADRLAPRVVNVHFEDRKGPDGALAFDHRLRPGVVESSNALALMRAVGLDVPGPGKDDRTAGPTG